jgi:hypothetical protein
MSTLRTRWLLATIPLLGLAACGGGGGDGDSLALVGAASPTTTTTTAAERPPLRDAAEACDVPLSTLAADNTSITLGTRGEEDGTTEQSISEIACVFVELSMPESVIQRIDHTRALDGMLSTGWDRYMATWTYHPDAGLFIVIEDEA